MRRKQRRCSAVQKAQAAHFKRFIKIKSDGVQKVTHHQLSSHNEELLTGVPGGFSRGSPVFAPPTDWSVSYELK